MNELHSSVMKQHNVRYDPAGILRYYSKITDASLPDESKNSILLPTRHYLNELLIQEKDVLVHHDGIREMLMQYKRITGLFMVYREIVRLKLRKCVVCRKYKGRPYSILLTSVLPTDGVAESDVPPRFMYVCLFTCATTCAVQLELVDSLAVLHSTRVGR